MQPITYLTVTSVLLWLVALIAASIIFIGARFIIAPLPAAKVFGVPASETEQGVLAAFLFIASLIPLGDLLNVYAHVGTKNVPALAIHGGTAVVMCVLAALVLHA